jgi:hypothetical protein
MQLAAGCFCPTADVGEVPDATHHKISDRGRKVWLGDDLMHAGATDAEQLEEFSRPHKFQTHGHMVAATCSVSIWSLAIWTLVIQQYLLT